ncbi:helix-turn-helix transcriptional regulator [Pseudomonas sp. SA3-5]|uniref:Helix-turn-helix transcriptional regulator n=1 Tax=Pseudomonas aestuarii TaxID=3018340 RepID=A0ABT4XE73_9PSED|nr:helix-turn-helix transcriptional regulator [Pseudomonas aestuarii]MDA7086523.1 helix-turn-helix transcriptional regulator [Pseudomonas aestuarii]
MLITPGVGERLREERDRLGLNQTDFGIAAGVSRGTQKAYELESSSPDIRYLSTVQGMGVDVLYLLTGNRAAADGESLSAGEAKVLEQYRSMTEESRASVERVAEALANYKI